MVQPLRPRGLPGVAALAGVGAGGTGAGSPDGIGFATARLLAELGAAVIIGATSARTEARVSELRGAGFDAAGVTADLTARCSGCVMQSKSSSLVARWMRR
jgi:3-oxoacyl-[acyl-carrier protein] reductase